MCSAGRPAAGSAGQRRRAPDQDREPPPGAPGRRIVGPMPPSGFDRPGESQAPPAVRFLDGVEPFEWPFDGDAGLAAACGRIADHSGSLAGAERRGIERMGAARIAEYSSGRRVAREALRLFGIEGRPLAARRRVPVWPDGVVGAIAHSRELALAVVGGSSRYAGVGVDLEPENRVAARLAVRLLNERERARLAEPDWRTLLFSAKESVYKAVHPAVGEFLGFADVEITARRTGRFSAATTRECRSTQRIEAGTGCFLRTRGHWLTVFLVPAR